MAAVHGKGSGVGEGAVDPRHRVDRLGAPAAAEWLGATLLRAADDASRRESGGARGGKRCGVYRHREGKGLDAERGGRRRLSLAQRGALLT